MIGLRRRALNKVGLVAKMAGHANPAKTLANTTGPSAEE